MFFFLTAWSQRPDADTFKIEGKELTIQPILHGTLALEYDGKVIYVDPYGGAKAFEGIKKPDLILITDIHGDHLNEKTLDGLGVEGVTIVAPQAVADQISEKYKNQLVILSNGNKKSLMGIDILAIPMYNLPESDDAKHVSSNGSICSIGLTKLHLQFPPWTPSLSITMTTYLVFPQVRYPPCPAKISDKL